MSNFILTVPINLLKVEATHIRVLYPLENLQMSWDLFKYIESLTSQDVLTAPLHGKITIVTIDTYSCFNMLSKLRTFSKKTF